MSVCLNLICRENHLLDLRVLFATWFGIRKYKQVFFLIPRLLGLQGNKGREGGWRELGRDGCERKTGMAHTWKPATRGPCARMRKLSRRLEGSTLQGRTAFASPACLPSGWVCFCDWSAFQILQGTLMGILLSFCVPLRWGNSLKSIVKMFLSNMLHACVP